MAIDSRQTRRLLDRMGVNMQEMGDVEEVIIRKKDKDLVLKEASVAEITAKGMRVFQVSGEVVEIERSDNAAPKFSDEDVLLVSQQANVSRERAQAALVDADGDLGKAILGLTT
ncbi:MAG: nascent polypeptide-associated complex protein [Nitrososphaerales archaeon]